MRAVLFDVDGVLLNSAAAHRRIWSAWTASVSLDFERVWTAAHGRRIADILAEVAPHLDPGVEEASIRRIMESEREGFPAMPGVVDLLCGLPTGTWGVVTSALARSVRERFALAGLPIPAVLIDNGAVARGKPDPEGYLAGAVGLGVAAGDVLVVEDAPPGVAAGKAAGMTVLAVASTHAQADLHEADLCVGSISDAVPVIRGWLGG